MQKHETVFNGAETATTDMQVSFWANEEEEEDEERTHWKN